ncbi:cupin domain-containing protein [Gordonia sp. (in: high G+C Gram-positive bacteria)]|uniref:cupin domain-containing protein n=1 Tax=Gordonia sp. (in: high G+C Gram-positive bacteria) TaxID=84139 RepID=UPI00260FA516|nr:cupin domain-containing protein [Gordonia sp. (in: high G+C Gram-positive bacteria)]HMS74699.1 cupin domain-containing protein [Gordonia sp. (in: high G+C Gram-positive bacteria)]
MPVFTMTDARPHEMHGARFESVVAPSAGSTELCAWRTTVTPGTAGQPHTVDHEEVFLVLAGTPTITLDGTPTRVASGSVIFAPAGSNVKLDNDSETEAQLWVTTVVGLTATTPSGDRIVPPWTL